MTTSGDIGPLRALIFDFDGLVCDTEGAQVLAATEVFAHHDATLPLDRWTKLIGTATDDDFWVAWLEEQVVDVDRQHALDLFMNRNQTHVEALPLHSGVFELLVSACQHKIPVAIASSSPTSWVHPLIKRFGIGDYFETIVCREHAPRAKPGLVSRYRSSGFRT